MLSRARACSHPIRTRVIRRLSLHYYYYYYAYYDYHYYYYDYCSHYVPIILIFTVTFIISTITIAFTSIITTRRLSLERMILLQRDEQPHASQAAPGAPAEAPPSF